MLQGGREDAEMQRKMAGYAGAASVILALGVPAAHTRPARHAPDTGPADRVTACGVERWSIKVGMDPDAPLVHQKAVVPTTIIPLRPLPAPPHLPLHNRLRPV